MTVETRDAEDLGVPIGEFRWVAFRSGLGALLGEMASVDGSMEFLNDLLTCRGVGGLDRVQRDEFDAFDNLRTCALAFAWAPRLSALLSGGS